MKLLFFLFIWQILFDETNEDFKHLEEDNISTSLLLGFDQYEYSNNLIQFLAYLRIIDFWEIENITFPISIKSNGRLRNLEENVVNMTCIKDSVFEDDYYNIYNYYNCSYPYNKTPSSVEFLNYRNFFINGIKANKLILTSYAKYLGSNIQEQTRNNSYLKSEILFFYNSTIINQIKNITIEGIYYNEFSENAYLLFNTENEKDFPCTMEKNGEKNDIYYLICKPLTSLEGNLNFVAVNLTDINKIMYLNFSENNSYVNFIIKPSSKKLSIGVIVAIVSFCVIFLSFIGLSIYFMKIKDLRPTPPMKYVNKSNNNNHDVNGSTFILNRK
jgi:hypothetical protein